MKNPKNKRNKVKLMIVKLLDKRNPNGKPNLKHLEQY